MDSFETQRLLLRPLAAEDEALYCALYTDPGVMAHIGAPLSREAALRGFVEARRRNADPAGVELRWTVVDRVSGGALGLFAVLLDRTDRENAEFGAMLLPAAHGRGLARELCDAVTRQAFDRAGWGMHRVWARHAVDHEAAAAALVATGFEPGPPLGADTVYAMTRERWEARRG